ncbi:MAG: glycoside hydrolase family 13 protein [Acidimicrobiia bacterium]
MNAPPRHWWETAAVYQIYVRSFADANGDGVGDLPGIRSRLAYLAGLGVDAVWLTPCYPSPQHDHGYDVADYFDIESVYGGLEAFDELLADVHAHGLRLVMDVVPNHCSWDHPWFRAALASPPFSAERERFYFRDGRGPGGSEPPNNWSALFGGPAWCRVTEPDGTPGQWYLQTFTPQQPDLNWSNHEVIEHFDRMLTFWFDRGVDGFRVDAVGQLGKAPGLPDAPPVPTDTRVTDIGMRNPYSTFRPEGHEVWRRWRRLVDDYERGDPGRDRFLVAEVYTVGRPELLNEYASHDEFHQTFAFDLLLAPWHAPSIRTAIAEPVTALSAGGLLPTWTLNNHDAQRMVTRYGRADATDPDTWSGNNLVNSDAPVDLEVGTRRARAMAVAGLALPGAIYLYQGEELGLPEVLDLPADARQDPVFVRTDGREIGRDGCRLPLPWTEDAAGNHGFSVTSDEGEPAPPWLPQPVGWGGFAVSGQDGEPASMLTLYREGLRVRRACASAMGDELVWSADLAEDVVAFERGSVLVVLNLSGGHVELPSPLVDGRSVLLSSVPGHHDQRVVPADAAVWLA